MAGGKLFLICTLFLASCAEILPLSGGEEDESAPKPVSGKQNPEQGAITFSGTELNVTFDEYFTLKDPTKTVEMNPTCGTLTVEQKNKNLKIKWSEALAPNTTYSLTLDGTIVDITEKNDTIHQFVFSTGMAIDTAKISGNCVDVLSNVKLANATVLLYEMGADFKNSTAKFKTRTNKLGQFQFNYLPNNKHFQLYAFVDANKNQILDVNETVGFVDTVLTNNSENYTIRLFQQNYQKPLKITILEPAHALITGRNASELTINEEKIEVLFNYIEDSALVYLPKTSLKNYTFIHPNGDTVIKSVPIAKEFYPLKYETKQEIAGKSILFTFNDNIKEYDLSKIKITQNGLEKSAVFSSLIGNLVLETPTDWKGDFELHFDQGAIKGRAFLSDSMTQKIRIYSKEELATLKFNLQNFEGDFLIELLDGKRVVELRLIPSGTKSILFENLIPKQYTLRCFQDSNKNGKWDSGDLQLKKQAEMVYLFNVSQKMKANWETEQTVEIK